jgi:acetolactate synthase-1/2/3 large subunit
MVDQSLIKLSDYVAQFIAKQNVKLVFAISGGSSLHLIHSVGDNPGVDYICTHHEQSAAMAADGYSRATGHLGVAIATSGPGATNLITGICGSFYDSVPLLLLTGQVSTFRMAGNTGVRQIGFQETPIVDMCQSITKYACQITDPAQIRYELEKAVYIACTGRPGPVLVDIPDNLQRSQVDLNSLTGYLGKSLDVRKFPSSSDVLGEVLQLIINSERPILVGGWGIHLSHTETEAVRLAETLNIPIALTWGAADLLPANHPLYVGTFGTHGMRHANFAVQNADLVISLGSRLDTKSTGSPVSTFSRDAKKVVVDIDPSELAKFSSFGLDIDILIQDDLSNLFSTLNSIDLSSYHRQRREWTETIATWQQVFSRFDRARVVESGLDPYEFIDQLSLHLPESSKIFIDTGCAIAWTMQRLRISQSQRIFHDFNNTAMGWALPAAIGGYFASPDAPIICIAGDGSFMMSMHELATVKHHHIPIKLFLLNNSGYSMIKQTQDQWLGSQYYASSYEGGLSFPNYKALASAFGFEYLEISSTQSCSEKLTSIFLTTNAVFCNVVIPPEARVIPQVKFGRPNEDMEPLLPREIFLKSMLIAPLDASKNI